ncbi:hypothetical protein SLU01_01510 [Sporosarcina luteola]|uniref:HNH endonuclease n=1 Tax=Sporosarcina luteola TaxID=582850 RepID=A0A511Z314_9BACL|nr:HNH endonuclease [Sporosarcina luteola]GEN81839.1 hypothetical protein SLU01_01510 [Sporosarcina luteola]
MIEAVSAVATEVVEAKELAEVGKEGMNTKDLTQKPVTHVETRNKTLEGDLHPITGVPFESKQVELPSGETVEGVFPEFESMHDVQLNESQYMDSDARQFKTANEQLAENVANDPELAGKFTEDQLMQIEAGDTPEGYLWHHSEEPGVLQLVDKDIHDKTGHTGGRSLWGGGSDFR